MNYHDRLKQLVAEKKLNDSHESELSKLTTDGDLHNLKGSVSPVSSDCGVSAKILLVDDSSQYKGDQPDMPGNPDAPCVMDREERRKKVLDMLNDTPESRLEVFIDELSDHDNVILMVAIRNGYSFEMHIARGNYDQVKTLEFIEKHRY